MNADCVLFTKLSWHIFETDNIQKREGLPLFFILVRSVEAMLRSVKAMLRSVEAMLRCEAFASL